MLACKCGCWLLKHLGWLIRPSHAGEACFPSHDHPCVGAGNFFSNSCAWTGDTHWPKIFETTWCNLVRRWPNKFMTLWLRSTKIWSLRSWVTQNLDHGIILFNFYGWIAPSWYHFKSKKTSIRHVFPTASGSKDKKLVQWNQEKDGKQLVAACLRTGYIFEKQVLSPIDVIISIKSRTWGSWRRYCRALWHLETLSSAVWWWKTSQ